MFRRLFLGALAALLVGTAGVGLATRSASAEVIENDRYTFSRTLLNPCNGQMLTLDGEYHQVWYTTPQGTVMMRYTVHYTGTDSAGTEYVFNARRVMEHWNWPTILPFSDLLVYDVISKGSEVNMRMTLSIDYVEGPPVVYVTDWTCRG